MPAAIDLREEIQTAIGQCAIGNLAAPAKTLFETLGYRSDRTAPWTLESFIELDGQGARPLTANDKKELRKIKSLHLIFQIGDAEISKHGDLFDSSNTIDAQRIQSYLFFAVDLQHGHYTRTELTTFARLMNKPLPMPAIVLFRHGEKDDPLISLAILRRRLNRRDASRDVLEKATLIKDIRCAEPLRAHIEILNDFSLPSLREDEDIPNFVKLHAAWEKRLDTKDLSKQFYQEIADWYFWSRHLVEDGTIRLPLHCDTEEESSLFLIRLLTRVIFCWFLIEKRLIPTELFRGKHILKLLKEFNPSRDPRKPDSSPTYYRAILQNLFFGTLNMPPEQRAFREKKKKGERYDANFGITNLWRYEAYFHDLADWETFAARVPFLNGGLFDCIDDKSGKKQDNFILDGFSDREDMGCHLPNDIFFGPERIVDLSKDYGEEKKKTARSKRAKVRGLIEILSRYKFTIEENTPLEEEIALDPELLGKVFENLLASYNPDTSTTARKALGAFYTPREIVSYMVDEALKSYLVSQVPKCKGALEDLFSNKAILKDIQPRTREALIAAIGRVKILDPACGSGAFPMGALHRLVDLLQKLDPNNESWKRDRLAEARRYRELLHESGAPKDELAVCDIRIAEIEKSFDTRYHALDFARKLYLIENCIYGVDIQPIATQIAKLRFFISLVVDQKVDPKATNLGVRPLPNLETRLVAADTLIPIEKSESDLFSSDLDRLRAELTDIRHRHFNAPSPSAKRKWREADEAKRQEIAEKLEDSHALSKTAARQLAAWDPYDQNTFAPFFDSEWMFGLPVGKVKLQGKAPAKLLGNLALINEAGGQGELAAKTGGEVESGFDIVIGNPPYVLIQGGMRDDNALKFFRECYEVASYKVDLYHLFIERSVKLLKDGGSLAFITPSNFATNNYCNTLRQFLYKKTQLREFLSFDENVFQASVNNWVFVLSRGAVESAKVAFYKGTISSGGLTLDLISAIEQISLREGHGLLVPPSDSKAGAVLEKIQAGRKILGDFATVNFGMQLRNRKQFLGDVIDGETQKHLMTRFHRPCVTGRDIKRFAVTNGGLYCYFNRTAKCGGCWDEAIHSAKDKVLVRQIGEYPEGGLDLLGHAVLNTAFMIYPVQQQEAPRTSRLLLAIINSPCVRFFWTNRFRDDRKTFPKIKGEYLKLIPIALANGHEADVVMTLVDVLTFLNCHFASSAAEQTTRDPLMVAYWERVLNGLVYELYFPEELHAAGLRLFDLVARAKLPEIDSLAEGKRLATLRQKFEELHDGTHPLRIALDKLQTLDTVRIIECKA